MTYRPYDLTESKTSIKMTKELDSILEPNDLIYMDLLHEAKDDSVVISVDRVTLVEGRDYVLSLVGSITRVTWVNSVAPLGAEALDTGDVVVINYEY